MSCQLWLSIGFGVHSQAWQPGNSTPVAANGFTVDTSNRRDVLSFHQSVYLASENYAANHGWTGHVSSGNAGTLGFAFKEDVRRRVNYYRALAGLPADITFNDLKSAKCQKAALMMSANHNLSHYPTSSWLYYSIDGRDAAAASNISLGVYGPPAVDGYMVDNGSGNHVVGHRRWLLFSRAREMATGDIPPNNGYSSSNSLWVVGDYNPVSNLKFIAWPNEGFTPSTLLPARWSLSYYGANFASAAVTMSLNGVNVPLTVVSRTDNGYGDNTLVWQPASLPISVTNDLAYTVNVTGIQGNKIPSSRSYVVRVFNPNILGEEMVISGASSQPVTGAFYGFNPISQADSYELEVSVTNPATWLEGAEDFPSARVTQAISPGYNLRQSALVRSGSRAFQLTFPPNVWTDQSFTIDRDFIPSSTSVLHYGDRARFVDYRNVLETRISADGGATWNLLASRNGGTVNGFSSEWDANWMNRSVSLATYAGQTVKIRYIMKTNGAPAYQGTNAEYGFFIDDIFVTNAIEPISTRSPLASSTTSFVLNDSTAGLPLTAGTSYRMRMRPRFGGYWFPYGPVKTVQTIATPPASFPSWATAMEISAGLAQGALSDPHGDPDRDGRCNLLEYAFAGSPTHAGDPPSRLPQTRVEAGQLVMQYRVDASLTDLSVMAEACTTMHNWKTSGQMGAPSGFSDHLISTEGSIQTREARVSLNPGGTSFLRLRVSRQ